MSIDVRVGPAEGAGAALAPAPVVREYGDADRAQWDEFVTSHPHGSPFHLIAWKKTVEQSFGYQPRYLLAEEAGRIAGVLPLFLVRNFLLGKALISSPFAVYGGILAHRDTVRDALYARVKELGSALGVDYIELRNAWPEQCGGVPNVSRYVTFTHETKPTEEALMEALPKKTRNIVRKAMREPFVMRYGVRDPRIMDVVHSRNMRTLGTPNFPRAYFANLLENFGSLADIREVWLRDRPMAVSLNFYFRGEMHTYHAAADKRYNALGPNTFLYFDHLRWAGANGYHTFDFGRSKRDTGTFEFKKHWSTAMRPLPYEIVLVKRKELPNFSPANPRFGFLIRTWRKIPLPVTRLLSRFALPLFP
jgi:FemAB-related protein (PEP-CTERM system-associated)